MFGVRSRPDPVPTEMRRVPPSDQAIEAPPWVHVVVDDQATSADGDYRRDGRPPPTDLVLRWRCHAGQPWAGEVVRGVVLLAFGSFLVAWFAHFGRLEGSLAAKAAFFTIPAATSWVFLKVAASHVRGMVNSVSIGVRRGELFTASGPLGAAEGRRLSVASVTDLRVIERVWVEPERPTLHLVAVVDGGELPLIDDLPSLKHAQFLEQRLEECLGLVAGRA